MSEAPGTTNPDPALPLDQAADYLGMSTVFVRREIAAGRLVGTFFGRRVRVRRSDLDAYMNQARGAGQPEAGRP